MLPVLGERWAQRPVTVPLWIVLPCSTSESSHRRKYAWSPSDSTPMRALTMWYSATLAATGYTLATSISAFSCSAGLPLAVSSFGTHPYSSDRRRASCWREPGLNGIILSAHLTPRYLHMTRRGLPLGYGLCFMYLGGKTSLISSSSTILRSSRCRSRLIAASRSSWTPLRPMRSHWSAKRVSQT